jgi:hypothetical protein
MAVHRIIYYNKEWIAGVYEHRYASPVDVCENNSGNQQLVNYQGIAETDLS